MPSCVIPAACRASPSPTNPSMTPLSRDTPPTPCPWRSVWRGRGRRWVRTMTWCVSSATAHCPAVLRWRDCHRRARPASAWSLSSTTTPCPSTPPPAAWRICWRGFECVRPICASKNGFAVCSEKHRRCTAGFTASRNGSRRGCCPTICLTISALTTSAPSTGMTRKRSRTRCAGQKRRTVLASSMSSRKRDAAMLRRRMHRRRITVSAATVSRTVCSPIPATISPRSSGVS